MDETLHAAYLATAYRVRLPRGGWATIRIGEIPPAGLLALAGPHPWGFVTACNPRSRPLPRQRNRLAQRRLLAELRALPSARAILPGLGVGDRGWREPSLFVVGPAPEALDKVASRHEQNAYVHGQARTPARLRVLAP